MDMTIKDQLRMARGQTRSNRKLTVTPLRCRDRRLVHRPFGADSLGGAVIKGEPWKYYDLGHGYCTYLLGIGFVPSQRPVHSIWRQSRRKVRRGNRARRERPGNYTHGTPS